MRIETQATGLDVVRLGDGGFVLYLTNAAGLADFALTVSPTNLSGDLFVALEAAVSAEWSRKPEKSALVPKLGRFGHEAKTANPGQTRPGYDANGSPVE